MTDAAALAAASQIDVATYRETGEIVFLRDVYTNGEELRVDELGLPASPANRCGDDRDQHRPGHAGGVYDAADLSSLIPGVLPFLGVYQITGTAEARIDGR